MESIHQKQIHQNSLTSEAAKQRQAGDLRGSPPPQYRLSCNQFLHAINTRMKEILFAVDVQWEIE